MAKMRATLRKATQVTPPPSPGDDGPKGHWLRNHSTPKCPAPAPATRNGRRAAGKTIRIKKEPVCYDDLNGRCSRSSTSSPICNGRVRTRSASEAASAAASAAAPPAGNFWGPRRSARLIGIPAELDMTEEESEEEEDEEEDEDREPESSPPAQRRTRRKAAVNGSSPSDRRISECSAASRASRTPSPAMAPMETNGGGIFPDEPDLSAISLGQSPMTTAAPTTPCKECKQRKKGRSIDALLVESERYLQYPSGSGSRTSPGCRMRSTYNSSCLRSPSPGIRSEESEEKPLVDDSLPLPEAVDQVKFSFELVPSGTFWYQTFLRDEAQAGKPLPEAPEGISSAPAPFLLPYEMSLEAILKSGRPERKKKKAQQQNGTGGPGTSPRKKKSAATAPDFRPIISTRLQMQSAARLAAAEAAASKSSQGPSGKHSGKRGVKPGRLANKLWHLPRKSPRCHASTLAILSSARTSEDEGSHHPEEEKEVEEEAEEEPVVDPEWAQTLQEMVTHDLRKRKTIRSDQMKKKRGRPRKYPLPEETESTETAVVADGPLTELLATPLHRIADIVDERIRPDLSDDPITFEDPLDAWVSDFEARKTEPAEAIRNGDDPPFVEDVFHDLDSRSTGGSGGGSSVYETASEVGSQDGSTGTCDSRGGGRNGKWRRRKRPNMTGWPRSNKKRRPLAHLSIDPEDENDGPPVLSPIREESLHNNVSGSSANADSPSRVSYVSKPFQFQRKTLRFVGKRILRPAAHRHAPQRLEYWPCFDTGSSSSSKRQRQPRSTSSSKSKGRKA